MGLASANLDAQLAALPTTDEIDASLAAADDAVLAAIALLPTTDEIDAALADLATTSDLAVVDSNVDMILADYARRTGDYATTDTVDAAQAALTALINNLPTTDELDTALALADDAVLAAIALLPTTDDLNDIDISVGELADIAAAVWASQTSDLSTSDSIGKLLVTDIDAKISDCQTLGGGSISWPITITVGGAPKDGVDVWVSTDSAGTNVVARGYTNASGVVTFMLDAGDYYCWKQLADVTFTNPETFTVT